jgi:hypothetical protein
MKPDDMFELLGGKNSLVAMVDAHMFTCSKKDGSVSFHFKGHSKCNICTLTPAPDATFTLTLHKFVKSTGEIGVFTKTEGVKPSRLMYCFEMQTGLRLQVHFSYEALVWK